MAVQAARGIERHGASSEVSGDGEPTEPQFTLLASHCSVRVQFQVRVPNDSATLLRACLDAILRSLARLAFRSASGDGR